MENKLCGPCAQRKGLTLEERVNIALSRKPHELYHCPECFKGHKYIPPSKKKTVTELAEFVAKTPMKKSKKQQGVIANEAKQLSFRDILGTTGYVHF